jgi:pimeloyl-ACP methyl ester carboxylesterase
MTTFVLVHGTGHGGWCWQRVSPLLRAAHADAYAPTLTGVSDRSHLQKCGVDLTTHITDVTNLLFYEDLSNVVLVGHSYGGMVITGVAARAAERLKQLIYLDAYVPDEGESEIDLWPPDMRAEIESDAQASGGLRAPPSPELLGINDAGLAAWVRERITPHPVATYLESVPPTTAQSSALPRAYIRCTEGPLVPVFLVTLALILRRTHPDAAFLRRPSGG